MTDNKDIINWGIGLKMQSEPCNYANIKVVTQPGRATFPYPHWFRGEYMSDFPVIVEREAGFRERITLPKIWQGTTGHAYPQHCFRPGTTVTYPCYPDCTEPFKRYDRTLQRYGPIYLYR
jgi:hypothetical protein